MSFLIFCSIYLSSLVHLKNGPEYFTRGTVRVFIPLMRFLQCSLVSSSFLVLLRYSFLFLLSPPHVKLCPLPVFLGICRFPFLRAFWFCIDLVVLFLPSYVIFRFSLLAWYIFYGRFHPNILTVYPHCPYKGFQSFLIFYKQFYVVMVYWVVDFFLQFVKYVSTFNSFYHN